MHDIYFEELGFKGTVPNEYLFYDLGFVPNLDEIIEKFESRLRAFSNIDLGPCNGNSGGRHLGISASVNQGVSDYFEIGSELRISYIFYNDHRVESVNTFIRGHEEAHAGSFLGLRKELGKLIEIDESFDISEEDFCNKAGIYAVRRKGLVVPHFEIVDGKSYMDGEPLMGV